MFLFPVPLSQRKELIKNENKIKINYSHVLKWKFGIKSGIKKWNKFGGIKSTTGLFPSIICYESEIMELLK